MSVCSGVEVGSYQRSVLLVRYLSNWLIVAESLPLLLQYKQMFLQLCQHLCIVINGEKLYLELSQRAQYLGMMLDIIRLGGGVHHVDSRIRRL